MPRFRLLRKTPAPKPKHRVTGKTSAFLTDFPNPPPAHPLRKITKLCTITVQRQGHPPQVYHTRSSNETLP